MKKFIILLCFLISSTSFAGILSLLEIKDKLDRLNISLRYSQSPEETVDLQHQIDQLQIEYDRAELENSIENDKEDFEQEDLKYKTDEDIKNDTEIKQETK